MDWMDEAIGDFEDDYLLIDCPGQIELFTHSTMMQELVRHLETANFRVCAAYLIESQFIQDRAKFFAGTLSAMSCMINLEVPHINVISKMDLIKGGLANTDLRKGELDR